MAKLKPPSRSRAGKERNLRTLYVRVPSADWGMVVNGTVTEFRVGLGNVATPYCLENVELPLPLFVVAYRTRPTLHKLMTLWGIRRERLVEITDDGLARAGYTGEDARDRFRRDWMAREKKPYDPSREVVVFTVRPPRDEDLPLVGANLVRHLYGSHLEAAELQGA